MRIRVKKEKQSFPSTFLKGELAIAKGLRDLKYRHVEKKSVVIPPDEGCSKC